MYHFIDPSPWPFLVSLTIGGLLLKLILSFHLFFSSIMLFYFMNLVMIVILWCRDVMRESTLQGNHSFGVRIGLESGMILFILSEVMFFFSFFWSFLHFSLSPSMEIGSIWPPIGIESINPFSIPFLNTIILLNSGISLTYSHHLLISNSIKESNKILLLTIMQGVYFTIVQLNEYKELSYSMSDSCYGSIFFMGTGFHGFHVLVGTLFLISSYYRSVNLHFSCIQHLGFEFSAWYWHFVDVVWIFLFLIMYFWSKF